MAKATGAAKAAQAQPKKKAETNPVLAELERMIRAWAPLIVINSYEEGRVIGHLRHRVLRLGELQAKMMQQQGYKYGKTRFWRWTETEGFQEACEPTKATGDRPWRVPDGCPQPDPTMGQPGSENPAIGLPWLRDQLNKAVAKRQAGDPNNPPDNYFVVFCDVAHYLDNSFIVRTFRDLAFAEAPATLVFLQPAIKLPQELEREAQVVEFPLPDAVEMEAKVLDAARRMPPEIARHPELQAAADALLAGQDVPELQETRSLVDALAGLTWREAELVIRQAAAAVRKLGPEIVPAVNAQKRQIVKRSGVLEFREPKGGMDQAGGLRQLKAEAQHKLAAYSPAAQKFGLRKPRAMLLVGHPGTGKSLLAEVMAGGVLPTLRMNFSTLQGSLVGETQANVQKAFRTIEAVSAGAGAIVQWDEVEKMLGGDSHETTGGNLKAEVTGMTLTWLQEQQCGAFVVATANSITGLRPEFIDRFVDGTWFVGLPSRQARRQIFEIHIRRVRRDPAQYDLAGLAAATDGYNGRQIEAIVEDALALAFRAGAPDMEDEHLVRAIKARPSIMSMQGKSIQALYAWASENHIPHADVDDDEPTHAAGGASAGYNMLLDDVD